MGAERTYAYARVSSTDQNLARQFDAFAELGIPEDRIISDKQSGKDLDRVGYLHLKNNLLREGDTLVIKSLDRLSRNKEDIKTEIEYFKKNKIRVKVIDLPTTMVDLPKGQEWVFEMVNNILIEVLGSIAEQERLTIKQRQAEGIESAKERGVKLGRPLACEQSIVDEYCGKVYSGKMRAINAYTEMNMTKPTFFRKYREYREARGLIK